MKIFAALLSFAFLALLLLTPACAPGEGQEAPTEKTAVAPPPVPVEIPAELKETLKASVKMLGGTLKGHLVAALDEKGTLGALEFCGSQAQMLTSEASTDEVFIHRVSLRLRNPANQPSEFERAQLERFEALNAEGKLPEGTFMVHKDGERDVAYFFKPLMMGKPCLLCHGDPAGIESEVLARLQELYPTDDAVGFAEGDLRGAFVARSYLN